MATGKTQIPKIPEDLMAVIEQEARIQQRPITDVFTEAVRRYLDDRTWQRVIEKGRDRAKAMGLTEEDVPRLIVSHVSIRSRGGSAPGYGRILTSSPPVLTSRVNLRHCGAREEATD